MTPPEIERIAKGLTKAQRAALRRAAFHVPTGQLRCKGVMHPADKNLRVKGLAVGIWLYLTPLGLSVRQYILEQEQKHG